MPNTIPIDTKTQVRRISLQQTQNLEQDIKNLGDLMGAAGYQLAGTFVVQTELILVFQLTR